jgi:tetratricopeptide (TPR) repeat protein
MKGECLGPYVLTELLGKGGFGEVWKARDERLGRWVAVKVLDVQDEDDLKRFSREARTAASLDHPNIAAVYDVELTGRPYIAMQLIDGAAPAGPLPPRDAARIARDAARAVAHAHGKGIVHRDLKPANLLVASGTVYVLDFGLARRFAGPTTVTREGQMIGTPAYMSPEQARGEKTDARSDIWGLGATLHELLAGSPPYTGTSMIDVLTRVVADDPAPLPKAPPELANVVAKCLQKDPRRRYATADELVADLERFLRGAAVSARAPARFARAVAKRPALVIGILAAAITAGLVARSQLSTERGLARRAELRRLDDAIATARPQFYIAGADIRAHIAAVEAALAELDGVEPKDAEIWTMIGIGRHLAGDLAGAEDALRRADAAGSRDPRMQHALSRVLFERSVTSLTITSQRPTSAVTRRASRRLEEALTRLDRCAGWGEESDRLALRGWRALAANDELALAAACNEGLGRYDGRPGAEEFWLLRGAVSKAADQVDCLTRALAIRPHDARVYVVRGTARFELGDYAGCVDDNTRALAIYPRFADAYANRSAAHRMLGRLDDTRADLDRALAIEPSHASAHANRASLFVERGDLDAAERDIEAALRAEPGWAFAHWVRGRIRRARGRFEDAVADATAAVNARPDVPGMRHFRAELLHELGRHDEAARDYGALLERDPRDATAWHGRAISREKLGDAAGAIDDDTQAIAADPGFAEALAHRGTLHRSLDDLDAAVRLQPANAQFRNHRGALRQAADDLDGAEADYDEAVRLDPSLMTARFNRGALRRERGRPAEALVDLDAAARLATGDPDIRLARGLARLDLGRRADAVADLREALRLAPAAWMHRERLEALLRELGE